MGFVLTEEQQMIKTSAREFLKERSLVSALRKLRDEKNKDGFDREVWSAMVALGWTALTISEEYGGLDIGYVGFGQVLNETGKYLTSSPLISSALVGSAVISHGGSDAQKKTILPMLADGSCLISMAYEEVSRFDPFLIETTAYKNEKGYILNGKKGFVLDGNVADKFIVTAIQNGEINFFIVDAKSPGIELANRLNMDSHYSAEIVFREVQLEEDSKLDGKIVGRQLLNVVLDIAALGLSSELLGIIEEAFRRTMDYIRERKQFGVAIGSFQALQHRAAHMYCEIELCKSLVLKGLQAIDDDVTSISALSSMTKVKLNEVVKLVTNEAIQMFGGIGVTDEEEIGFFLKRARVAQQTFGDTSYHLDRFARLKGF